VATATASIAKTFPASLIWFFANTTRVSSSTVAFGTVILVVVGCPALAKTIGNQKLLEMPRGISKLQTNFYR
jgi:hypothetical protein